MISFIELNISLYQFQLVGYVELLQELLLSIAKWLQKFRDYIAILDKLPYNLITPLLAVFKIFDSQIGYEGS